MIHLFSLDSRLWDSLHLAMSFIQSGQWSMGQSTPGYVIHSVWTVVYGTVYTWLRHSFSLDTGLWDSRHTGLTFIQSGQWSMGQPTHRSMTFIQSGQRSIDNLHLAMSFIQSGQWSMWVYTWLRHTFSLDSGLWDSLHLAKTYIQSGQWSMGQSTPG